MLQFNIEKIRNVSDLSKYFNLSLVQVIDLANEDYKKQNTRIIGIKKPNKKFREVIVVEDIAYSVFLKTLLGYLYQLYSPLECVQGYIKKKNIVTNAQEHLNKKYILKFDILNFFYSININDIKKIFLDFGSNIEIAEILSKIVTYNNILFPGMNTSPILANMHCKYLDDAFLNLCKIHAANYTRYADDITISSNSSLPEKEEIINILSSHNFSLNENKYKVMPKGKYQVVTGLTVFDKTKPRIPRNLKRKIRLALFLRNKLEAREYSKNVKWMSINYFDSLIQFYIKIEPAFISKLLTKYPSNGT